MKNYFIKIFLLLLFSGGSVFISSAQTVSGTVTIGVEFATVKMAIDTLNMYGVTGNVVVNVPAGYTETAPSGGLSLGSATLNASLSASNTLTFIKSGVGANPLITAFTGGTATPSTIAHDVIFRLVGTDYVTIDGIDLAENGANGSGGPANMEVGYGLYKRSTTDGCNNNIIQNCTITLEKANITNGTYYVGSCGIVMINTIPSAASTSLTITNISGANSNNKFYSNTIQNCNTGISLHGFAAASPYTLADQNNDIGGFSLLTGNIIKNYGGGGTSGPIAAGVRTLAQYNLNVSYNTINNNDGAGVNTTSPLYGILTNTAAGASETVSYNTITLTDAGTTVKVVAIENVAGSTPNGNTININNNTISQTCMSRTTGIFYGIFDNGSSPSYINLNNNTLALYASGLGDISGIWHAGNPALSVNMNNNHFDTLYVSTSPSYAGSIYLLRTNNVSAANTATLDASGNVFKGLNIAGASGSTGSIYFIYIKSKYASSTVNNNNFNNLQINGGANIYLASDEAATPLTAFNNNFITTGLTKLLSGGTLNLYSNIHATNTSGVLVASGNNFSNITLTGATVLNGVYARTSTTQALTFTNNVVSNITAGTGNVYGILVAGGNTGSVLSSNSVYNISSAGSINGIWLGIISGTAATSISGFNNVVYGLNSTGAAAVRGFSSEVGTIRNIYQNKVYDITANNAGGSVSGIYIAGALTTANIYNNVISNLKAPLALGTNPVIGINITSGTNVNVYNNSVHLSASSTGVNFGTSALFAATGTTLTLRNNLLVNVSVPSGTGLTVAYRRSSNTLTSYATASDKNIFYAGTPGVSNLIFNDGTNSDQTLVDFKTRVGVIRDASSYSESPTFIDTTGANPYYLLVPDSAFTTSIEAGADSIPGILTDVNGNPRAGSFFYNGTSGLPDIGAVEGNYPSALASMIVDSNTTDQLNTLVKIPFGSTNQGVLRIKVYCTNPINAMDATYFEFNTDSTTNNADLLNAKLYYTGSSSTFSAGIPFGVSASPSTGSFSFTDTRKLKVGVNYFWLTYDLNATGTSGNLIDAALTYMVVSGNSYFPIDGSPDGYSIAKGPLNGIYYVGAGQTGLNYSTISSAVNDLNFFGVSGPVTFLLTDATYNTASGEVFPIVINNVSGSSSVNTITLMPDSGVTASINQSTANPLIRLNGTKYFTLDGHQNIAGIPQSLTLRNDHFAGMALAFINDATANTIKSANLRGSSTSATGGVINFGAGLTTGNDSNLIDDCMIGDGGTVPTQLLVAIGSSDVASKFNDHNTVSNCQFFNWFSTSAESMALKVTKGNTAWTITGNHFYQTASRTGSGYASENYHFFTRMDKRNGGADDAIAAASLNDMVITNNYFGGSAPYAAGSPYTWNTTMNISFTSIYLFLGKLSSSRINNNTIANMQMNVTNSTTDINWTVLYPTGGMCNVDSNIIGSVTGGNSIVVNALSTKAIEVRPIGYVAYDNPNGSYSCSNNMIGGITAAGPSASIKGIYVSNGNAGVSLNIRDNKIGNDSTDNIIAATASVSATPQSVAGIYSTSTAALHIKGNTIQNLRNNAVGTGVTASNTIGIFSGAGTDTIQSNIIRNLSSNSASQGNTTSSASIIGIAVSTANAGNQISQNKIYSLNHLNALATGMAVNGLNIGNTAGSTVSQNSIYGLTTQANGIIYGISMGSGTAVVANNMITLGKDSTGVNINSAPAISGIYKSGGDLSAYHNSILITGGVPVSGGARTYAFQTTASLADVIKNNIFANERLNYFPPGSGHMAINLASISGTTINNNNYNAVDTLGLLNNISASDLTAWKALSLQDVNSLITPITFVSYTSDLHLDPMMNGNVQLVGASIPAVTTDFDGDVRSGLFPYIGADEIATSPLPVTLLSFTAKAKSKDVYLDWVTASEQNNKGFEIHISTDNKHFENIGFVKGTGNSNTKQTYHFVQEKAFERYPVAQLYYKLKQVDNDGQFVYSNTVSVTNNSFANSSLANIASVYPNPFRDNINITTSSAEAAKATVLVTDLQGRVLMKKELSIEKGTNTKELVLDEISTGIYLLRLELKGETQTIKIIKTQ